MYKIQLVATRIEWGLLSKASLLVQNLFCLFLGFPGVVRRRVPEEVPEQVQNKLAVAHGRHGALVARPQRTKRRGQTVWK